MPEQASNSSQRLLPLESPEWLIRAIAPWRVEAAAYIAGAGRWTPAANVSADTRLRAMGSGLRAQGFGLWAQGFGS